MMRERPFKITIVGDGTVGKTCMLVTYMKKAFPEDYIPTVFDNYADTIEVDGGCFNVTLWDTAGQEEYERLRILSYPNTDVFLLCYAVDNETSFKNVTAKWIPELRHHCPSAHILLVGTKTDLRGTEVVTVSNSEGQKLARRIRAARHIECSALSANNLNLVFVEAVRVALEPHKKTKRNCLIL